MCSMHRDNRSGLHGRNIREPKITSMHYIGLNNLSRLLAETIQNYVVRREDKVTILDLGCGGKPYQPFFAKEYSRYIGVDINRDSLADVIASGDHLPFKENSFSVCLCTQVIEHVTDPEQVTREVTRVLDDDGVLLLSTHTIAPIHNYPSDYWRWTDQGLKKMLAKHFADITVQEVTTRLETIFHLASICAPIKRFSSIYFALINSLAQLLRKNSMNTRLPKLISLYLVVAHKNKARPPLSYSLPQRTPQITQTSHAN